MVLNRDMDDTSIPLNIDWARANIKEQIIDIYTKQSKPPQLDHSTEYFDKCADYISKAGTYAEIFFGGGIDDFAEESIIEKGYSKFLKTVRPVLPSRYFNFFGGGSIPPIPPLRTSLLSYKLYFSLESSACNR